jgi:hypothetical protein
MHDQPAQCTQNPILTLAEELGFECTVPGCPGCPRFLEQTDPEHEDVKSVTFFVNPDRLSALVILANYARPDAENVIVPWAAGCQMMGIYAYRELERERPRGLIGLTDISARKNVRSMLGEHVLSFTAPAALLSSPPHL